MRRRPRVAATGGHLTGHEITSVFVYTLTDATLAYVLTRHRLLNSHKIAPISAALITAYSAM
jgi:hypothetical protein